MIGRPFRGEKPMGVWGTATAGELSGGATDSDALGDGDGLAEAESVGLGETSTGASVDKASFEAWPGASVGAFEADEEVVEGLSTPVLGDGALSCTAAADDVAAGALGGVAVGAELHEARAAAHTAALATAPIRRNLTSTG